MAESVVPHSSIRSMLCSAPMRAVPSARVGNASSSSARRAMTQRADASQRRHLVASRPSLLSACTLARPLQALMPPTRRAQHAHSPRSSHGARCQALVAGDVTEGDKTEGQYLFPVGPGTRMQVTVSDTEVVLTTTVPGDSILHWGLQVKGSEAWYLPEDSRPEGTVQYKDRALQTPLVAADGYSWLRIALPDKPDATALNFVLKDAGDTWYKAEDGSHWSFPLATSGASSPLAAAPQPPAHQAAAAAPAAQSAPTPAPQTTNKSMPPAPTKVQSSTTKSPAAAPNAADKMPMAPSRQPPAVLPVVNVELQNLWAYRMWEEAGGPNRDYDAQQEEFEVGCKNIEKLLMAGYLMEELWASARGITTFPPPDTPPPLAVKDSPTPITPPTTAPPTPGPPNPPVAVRNAVAVGSPRKASADDAPPKQDQQEIPKLPEAAPELCGIKAYIMWEQAGKPNRTSEEEDREYKRAIEELNKELRAGKTLQEIETALKSPAPASSSSSPPSAPAQQAGPEQMWAPGHSAGGRSDVMSWIESNPCAEGTASPDEGIVQKFLNAENNHNEWTLMHRCNLVKDLLKQTMGMQGAQREATLSALYVYMRYSATRALTWQRNYNTQPRQLSGAMDSLTGTLAHLHGEAGTATERWYIRGILSCIGAGGDGQRIRDDILHIMHRHNIKEQKGTWMEQWHQKLHNNTTFDDVVICEAYLAFLKGHGDNGAYWRVMSEGGVTRERLESFARAITLEPEDFPHCRDGLIHDFKEYLKVLKSVHAGTDLEVAANAARNSGLPDHCRGPLDTVLGNRHHPLTAMSAAVQCRAGLRGSMSGNRSLMYLDLSLEDVIRGCAERSASSVDNLETGSQLFAMLLENLCLSVPLNKELCTSMSDWNNLPEHWWGSKGGALQAVSVVDRVRRALGELSDVMTSNLQATAERLGNDLNEVADWQTKLFSEEVVRGSAAFAVSLVCTEMDPMLRQVAEMGAWQIISPGKEAVSVGRVLVIDDLHSVQEEVYPENTVMVCQTVGGDEEIPDGVVACFTPNAPDVLSHVSVRARNCEVLFATCYDSNILNEMRAFDGKMLEVTRSPAGDITFKESTASATSSASKPQSANGGVSSVKMVKPEWCKEYAIGMDAFKKGVVGSKSRNLAELRGRLPEWINLPASVAVPFATFEAVLDDAANSAVKTQLASLYAEVETDLSKLEGCAQVVMQLQAPAALKTALDAEAASAGVPWDSADVGHWDKAFAALKSVWASQYNQRAYLSLRKAGLPHAQLCMAVLVQRVVPADYAFVIHTVNPSSGNTNEIYIEMVKGLGETLVGNYAGRALSAIVQKDNLASPEILSYPSKSVGLFVDETLIFRSDSNGEDLEGYAGAGLYDSVPMDHWEERAVNQQSDQLMQNPELRRQVLELVAQVGAEVEKALGTPQDIEGAVEMTADGPKITLVQTRPQM